MFFHDGYHTAMKGIRQWLAGLLAVILLFLAAPAMAETRQSLRVGFYAYDGYHVVNEDGTRGGYGYDLLQLMSRYANVNYEYCGYENNQQENLDMLEKGEIDLVTSIKWTEEMARRFDFSERSIGTASTVLNVKAGNIDVISGDYSTYNGIRIGFLQGSARKEEFEAYSQEKNFTYESVYYDNTQQMAEALQNGEVDALASTSLRVVENEWTIDSFLEAPIYIIVRKGDGETLQLVNHMLDRMEIEELHWRNDLQYKHYGAISSTIPFLTQEERAYLARQKEEGIVYRVLVNPDRYPYSYMQDGKLIGIMVDLFDLIARRAGIDYEWIIPENREDYAMRLQNGETDICIDMTPDYYQAEINGYTITDTYLTAPFSWLRRTDSVGGIKLAAKLVYMAYTPAQFAYDNAYHQIDYHTYDTHEECVESVLNGTADGYCTYTYFAEQLVLNDLSGKLVASIAQAENQFAIGVTRKHDVCLTTILNATVDCIEEWERISIIRSHTSFSQPKYSVVELILKNRQIATIVIMALVTLALLVLLIWEQLRYQKSLKKTISHQGDRLSESLQGMLSVLATAIEYRSSEAGDHVYRISEITRLVLRELTRLCPNEYGMTNEQIDQISQAAVLHDVGKIAVPDHILNKPGKLTPTEFEVIKSHPIKGCELLERIPNLKEEPLYAYAWDICRWHHERWDGRGYPDGLKGNQIPIWAQVAAIADVYDALTNPRAYKEAFSREKAVEMILGGECGQFNPAVLNAFQGVAPMLRSSESNHDQDFRKAPAGRELSTLLITAFHSLLDTTRDMIYLKDVDLVYRAVSPAFAEYFGRRPEEIVCRDDSEILTDEALILRSISESRELLDSGKDQIDCLEVYGERDGLPVYMSASRYLLTDSQGRIMGILGIIRDVTPEFFTKRHHQLEMQKVFVLEKDVFFSVCIDVTSWRIITEKRQSINGLSFPIHDTIGILIQNAGKYIVDRRGSAYSFYKNISANKLSEIYANGQNEMVMEYLRKMNDENNQLRWVRDEIRFLIDPHNGHLCAILTVRDIQEKKEAEMHMIERAERDPLTSLLNRSSISALIPNILAKKNQSTVIHAFFMIDLDNLKQVNDELGHQWGDKCLKETAEILRNNFRASDLIARIGGDEFIVFMRYASSREDVIKKACQLQQQLYRKIGPGPSIQVGGSIGISFYPQNGTTLEELYEKADQAMYRTKWGGKNGISIAKEE